MQKGRFLLACLVAAGVILWAPFASQVRAWIRAEFPGHFVLVVGSAIAAIIGVALLVTVWRIRERRALRYGLLAAALLLGVGYSLRYADGRPDIDVVERVHFVQFGIVTLLFYRAWRRLNDWSVLALPYLAGLLVGTFEEWFQWFIPVRVGEMRDIFLNSAAIGSGLLFSVALDPPDALSWRLRPGSFRALARFAAVVLLALAGFFHTVHLGYEIHDEEIGTFRSRYTAPRLLELSDARAERWKADPPPLTVPRFSREDQFLTEGIEHVRRRNELWEAKDIAGAWHENRILEKFYAPVVDVRSYHAKAGNRWPEEQRHDAQLAATLTADASLQQHAFVSHSNPAPIYTWSKMVYWAVVGAVFVVLLAVPVLIERRSRGGVAASPA